MALSPGCSLILDFSESAPVDASFDAPYTQAECDYMEPNDSPMSPMTITATDMGPAAICAPSSSGGAEDIDNYKFTAASATVIVAIQFTNRPGGDLDMKLLDGSGSTTLSQSRGFGDGEMLTCPGNSPACPALTAGSDYVLQVFPAVPGSVNAYTFTLMP
ncbi:MAG TPA: hypothetical protein VIV11_27725 [Kofleriaceae bacterium]